MYRVQSAKSTGPQSTWPRAKPRPIPTELGRWSKETSLYQSRTEDELVKMSKKIKRLAARSLESKHTDMIEYASVAKNAGGARVKQSRLYF